MYIKVEFLNIKSIAIIPNLKTAQISDDYFLVIISLLIKITILSETFDLFESIIL